jgi:AbiV family abortive infection protein
MVGVVGPNTLRHYGIEGEARMKKKLDAYRERLDPAQITAGMNAAARNAHRLAEDAATLLDARRFPSAAALAILAIEEAGKISVLRELSIATSDNEVAEGWKTYRTHTRKNVTWPLPTLVAAGAQKLDDFRPLFSGDSDHPYVLDQLKQIAFYTDCLGDVHWSIPDEVVDESLARMLVDTAKVFARGQECTEQEVILWIEHLGPVFKQKDLDFMKQALASWYAAMQASGLKPDGPNEMEQFIQEGIGPDVLSRK